MPDEANTLPPLMGRIADITHNLQFAFIVPLIACAYVGFYGFIGHKLDAPANWFRHNVQINARLRVWKIVASF